MNNLVADFTQCQEGKITTNWISGNNHLFLFGVVVKHVIILGWIKLSEEGGSGHLYEFV